MAALLNSKVQFPGQKVVAVISGGNIDVNMLSRIVDKGLGQGLVEKPSLPPVQLHQSLSL